MGHEEEEAVSRKPFLAQYIDDFKHVSDEDLPSNTQLPLTLVRPMAELATQDALWAGMLNHQMAKTKAYKLTLPEDEREAYAEKVGEFIKEHYKDWDKENPHRPYLAAEDFRNFYCRYSLSVNGNHHNDVKELGTSMVETLASSGGVEQRE